MRTKANEFIENAKTIVSFTVSMARDVSKYLKEEKSDTDYAIVADVLGITI